MNCSEGKLFFVEDDPDAYYQCNNGELVLKTCPKGQEINREAKTCSPKLVSLERSTSETERECYDNKVFDSRKKRSVSRDSFISNKGQCNHGETRRKEGSCKQYYECKDGTEVLSRCMDCQNYDEKQKRCRYVFDSPCDSQFPEPPTTSASDLTTGHGVWTSDPTPSENEVTELTERSTRTGSEVTEVTEGSTGAGSEVTEVSTVSGSEVTEVTEESTGTGSEVTEVTEAVTGTGSEVREVTETSTSAWNEATTAPNATAPPSPPDPESSALPFGDCRHRRALPDCKYFLECREGELVTRRCGWLQYFDSVTSTCSFMGYKCYGTE